MNHTKYKTFEETGPVYLSVVCIPFILIFVKAPGIVTAKCHKSYKRHYLEDQAGYHDVGSIVNLPTLALETEIGID